MFQRTFAACAEAASMLFDTDLLIWVLRGNTRAAKVVNDTASRSISAVTYMELLQGARDKADMRAIKSFLTDMQFEVLPLTENIGRRASIYMEEYVLFASISMADALIAATAVEGDKILITGNVKHYRVIKDLEIKRFRP
jgi:predicted nucleic acid-binding protein